MEIIAPSDFDEFFGEVGAFLDGRTLDEETIGPVMEIAGRYDLEMRPESAPELCEEYGLRM